VIPNAKHATGLVYWFQAEFNQQFSMSYLQILRCYGSKTFFARVRVRVRGLGLELEHEVIPNAIKATGSWRYLQNQKSYG
jgi:hypothetical protein